MHAHLRSDPYNARARPWNWIGRGRFGLAVMVGRHACMMTHAQYLSIDPSVSHSPSMGPASLPTRGTTQTQSERREAKLALSAHVHACPFSSCRAPPSPIHPSSCNGPITTKQCNASLLSFCLPDYFILYMSSLVYTMYTHTHALLIISSWCMHISSLIGYSSCFICMYGPCLLLRRIGIHNDRLRIYVMHQLLYIHI